MRLRVRATQRDRVAADRDRRSAAGRRRACAGAAATGGFEHAGVDPALARQRTAAAALPIGVPDNRTGSRATSTCEKTGSCSTATRRRDVGTFVYRVGDQRGHLPDAAGVCRRDVQPHDRRAEPGRELEIVKP